LAGSSTAGGESHHPACQSLRRGCDIMNKIVVDRSD
jgi:hypothetical protein